MSNLKYNKIVVNSRMQADENFIKAVMGNKIEMVKHMVESGCELLSSIEPAIDITKMYGYKELEIYLTDYLIRRWVEACPV